MSFGLLTNSQWDRPLSPWDANAYTWREYQRPLKCEPTSKQADALRAPSEEADRQQSIKQLRSEPSILERLTVNINATYTQRNPRFSYDLSRNPRRVLTKPHVPCHNDGYDNEKGDLILYVHSHLYDTHGADPTRYRVIEMLGSGTFGQVARCCNLTTGEMVAIKVVKNKPAYSRQGVIEIDILRQMNAVCDDDERRHVVRLISTFVYKHHLCLVFELLSVNLYELTRRNRYHGLSMHLVHLLSRQVLEVLSIIRKAGIIHCDLKPENILLKSLDRPEIKVIDFGSACRQHEQLYTYIQSRFYRSPDVLLGVEYTTAIDMWSFGCVVAELIIGAPLFPGNSEYSMIWRMTELFGLPPRWMIENSRNGRRYFKETDGGHNQLKSVVEYCLEQGKNEKGSKKHPRLSNLDDMILRYRMPFKNMNKEERDKETRQRKTAIDFLRQIFVYDPHLRLTPEEAMQHPFMTGANLHKGQSDLSAEPRKRQDSLDTPPVSPGLQPQPTPLSNKTEGHSCHTR